MLIFKKWVKRQHETSGSMKSDALRSPIAYEPIVLDMVPDLCLGPDSANIPWILNHFPELSLKGKLAPLGQLSNFVIRKVKKKIQR